MSAPSCFRTERDKSRLDYNMAIEESATVLKGLTREQKLLWAAECRERGNVSFRAGNYKEASKIYVQVSACLSSASSGKVAPKP